MSHFSLSVVIPAAGIGRRFGSALPKQYCKIGTKTILEYTIEKWLQIEAISEIIIAIAPHDAIFQTLKIAQHKKVKWTYGGQNRADSVLVGILKQSHQTGWTLVHDGARPCVTLFDIQNLIDFCLRTFPDQNNGAILAHRLTDTIKQSQPQRAQIKTTIDRSDLWAALTPQMFPTSLLKLALTRAQTAAISITDEASALESIGISPYLLESDRRNIKITLPEDLALARYYLTQQGIFCDEASHN